MEQEYDYIVVGGGSSGCVVAGRLAEANVGMVLLLECGEPAEANPETLHSDGYKDALANDRVIWSRFTTRQKNCANRRLFAGTGTGMGGSGSVNGQVYTRGAALDYDEWPEGWKWRDVAPLFDRLEQRLRPHRRDKTRFTETCIAAAREVGFRIKEDLNDGDLSNVFGYEWMNYEGATRRSSYVAFVKENAAAERLTVLTGARSERILFDNNRRANAVVVNRNGQQQTIRARREIVLCAGALETPKLLMLSGIGPAAHLKSFGIDVVLDQPQIGENLHDHPNVTLFFKGKNEVDCYHPQLYGFRRVNAGLPLPAEQADTCFVFYAARSSLYQAMKRMLPALVFPVWLYRQAWARGLLRALITLLFKIPLWRKLVQQVYGIVVILGKPMSRGRVRLASTDPREDLAIDPNYYGDDRDMQTMLQGLQLARDMAAGKKLTAWGAVELIPGARSQSEAKLRGWIGRATMTTFHFAGTCSMGEGERFPTTVDLRLKGVSGLRIGDASAIPSVPVSAMNAPSMLVGWRAADFIIAAAQNQSRQAA